MPSKLLFGILLAFTACHAVTKASETLEISIAPEKSHKTEGESIRASSPFYIVIANTSESPKRVWEEWCSWGYHALELEYKKPDGSVALIHKKVMVWADNFPNVFVIRPKGYLVLRINLAKDWDGYPSEGIKTELRACYKISSSELTKKEGVWTGEVQSPWINLTISK
jgi:hypothetical protein